MPGEAHSRTYLSTRAVPVIDRSGPVVPSGTAPQGFGLPRDRAIFTDLDQNLLGDPDSLPEFVEKMRRNPVDGELFGIATGRRLDSALRALRRNKIPEPDVLITSGGTQIHYAPDLNRADVAWARHIDHHWMPAQRSASCSPIRRALPCSRPRNRSWFKISYYYDPRRRAPPWTSSTA